MRLVLTLIAFQCCSSTSFAQSQYLSLGDSLIHRPTTMPVLTQKVAAKHLEFNKRPRGIHKSAQQGYGRYFRIYNAKFPLDSLKQDLKKGLNDVALSRKYPGIEWIKDSVLIYRFERTNSQGEIEQVFAEAPYKLRFGFDPQNWIQPDAVGPNFVFETYLSGNSGKGFVFYDRLVQQPMPAEFASMLDYVEHMVGQYPSGMFASNNKNIDFQERRDAAEKIEKFMGYRSFIPLKERDSLTLVFKTKYARSADFRADLEAVVQALLLIGNPNAYEVTEFVLPCLSLERQFELLCKQPLDWSCGNDHRPRYHILNTAQVAATLGELSVFTQAHFRIINDGYGRNEGYPGKRTYFRELEAVGIDGISLVIGASLFSTKRPKGNIEALGKSITEIAQPAILEARLLECIANPKLDELNRLRLIWLYRNYANSTAEKLAKLEKLRSIAHTLPPKLREALAD